MPRYALKIEYDGRSFSGWQRQASAPSVQQAVERAISQLEPDCPPIAAAGRTDAGVHALGQVAHCDTARDWDPFRLSEAVNHHLKPNPVAILACSQVDNEWHARYSATGRRYLYRIVIRRAPLVHHAGKAWRVRHPLDADAMRKGAEHLVGKHDFTTFRSAMCQAKNPIKTLDEISFETRPYQCGLELRATFRARSFLHNQVRSIIGTLERVGAGAWTHDDVKVSLESRDRAACGPVAPPDGLYLERVHYDPEVF